MGGYQALMLLTVLLALFAKRVNSQDIHSNDNETEIESARNGKSEFPFFAFRF
jgi:hypothetical protein